MAIGWGFASDQAAEGFGIEIGIQEYAVEYDITTKTVDLLPGTGEVMKADEVRG